MAAFLMLALIALIVGFFCGCTSIGGILLIPAIVLLSSLDIHQAMATALFSFALMSVLGTGLHHRKGSINWKQAVPMCCGAMLCGYVGAKANTLFSPDWLRFILAGLILFAGLSTLRSTPNIRFDVTGRPMRTQCLILFALGAFVGFMAGLTGVGGPVLSVPFMIGMGFSPLYSIAIGQPLQVVAGTSGSVANILSGSIDYVMATWVTLLELFGFYMGIIAAYRMKSQWLRKIISCLCILTSLYLFIR